jgi:hypothetical protein
MDQTKATVRYTIDAVAAAITFYTTHLGFTVGVASSSRLRRGDPRCVAVTSQRSREFRTTP